jgi:hypothetical protein
MALEAKQAAEFALTPVGKMVKSMEAINQVAKFYAASDFVPATFKGKPDNCTIAIDMATRMGMNPIMVMQQMYIVNGKPSISTQLVIAMINNCGEFEPLKFESNGKGGDDFGMRALTVRKKDPDTRLEGTWITMKMVKASKWGAKLQEIPEQMFKYHYNTKDEVIRFGGSSHFMELFEGHTDKSHVATHIYFGVSPRGYYVAVADRENTYCIPKEWYMLKSFVDGKKEYIKGAKKQSVP